MYSKVDSAWQKMHAYQLPGGIVDKDQQDAWLCSILEPPVVRSVDLDQFAKAWSAQSWLLDLGLALGSSLPAWQTQYFAIISARVTGR
jgi:hypothetical protein